MTLEQIQAILPGSRITYDDGREVHTGSGTVLYVNAQGMLVQFDDRASSTWIEFSDAAWMDFIALDLPASCDSWLSEPVREIGGGK